MQSSDGYFPVQGLQKSAEDRDCVHIPGSLRSAAAELRAGFAANLATLSKQDFIRIWASLAYLFPSLHPDGFEDAESLWPVALKRFAREAWRRAQKGDLSGGEVYQSDAQWCGIYDRMKNRTNDEICRRMELAGI